MSQDERLLELISASLDDALEPGEQEELEAALATSLEARQLADELGLDRQVLRSLPALVAPEELRERTLRRIEATSAPVPTRVRPWQRAILLAASVALVIGVSTAFGPNRSETNTLYLSLGKLKGQAVAVRDELRLQPISRQTMVWENVSGDFLRGEAAQVHLLGDAGTVTGGKLSVRLNFDFDGDGQVDLRSQARVVEMDDTEGYQHLVLDFPPSGELKSLRNGSVQLEVACENGTPLTLKLDSQRARVSLPFAASEPEV